MGGAAESGSGDEKAVDEGWRHCHSKAKSINQITDTGLCRVYD